MPAATILVLGSDAGATSSIESVLSGAGYTVAVFADPDAAFPHVAGHDLVVLDALSGPRDAIAVCAEFRATPSIGTLPVLCVSATDDVEERIRFLEAGADDVMARPFDARELEARVEALLLRFQRSRDLGPVIAGDGIALSADRRVVTVFSPKGGVGTTTIATNIAVATAADRPGRVLLVDLDLQFGTVATHLDVAAPQHIADVARDELAGREPEILRSYAVHHASGVHVLAAPIGPEFAELVTPAALRTVLQTAMNAYDRIVIDAGSSLDERTLVALEFAETVVLPVHPEIAALKAMHALLEYLNESGALGAKAIFVLNDMFARDILKLRDVESALGSRIGAELPYDPFLYLKAVNEGVPVVLGAPRSTPAERLVQLAAAAFGEASSQRPAAAGGNGSRRGGLLGALRRRD